LQLLDNYNDQRRKSFFNLLEPQGIKGVIVQIADEIKPDMSVKVKSATAVSLFQAIAKKRNITLKLNKESVKNSRSIYTSLFVKTAAQQWVINIAKQLV